MKNEEVTTPKEVAKAYKLAVELADTIQRAYAVSDPMAELALSPLLEQTVNVKKVLHRLNAALNPKS